MEGRKQKVHRVYLKERKGAGPSAAYHIGGVGRWEGMG